MVIINKNVYTYDVVIYNTSNRIYLNVLQPNIFMGQRLGHSFALSFSYWKSLSMMHLSIVSPFRTNPYYIHPHCCSAFITCHNSISPVRGTSTSELWNMQDSLYSFQLLNTLIAWHTNTWQYFSYCSCNLTMNMASEKIGTLLRWWSQAKWIFKTMMPMLYEDFVARSRYLSQG